MSKRIGSKQTPKGNKKYVKLEKAIALEKSSKTVSFERRSYKTNSFGKTKAKNMYKKPLLDPEAGEIASAFDLSESIFQMIPSASDINVDRVIETSFAVIQLFRVRDTFDCVDVVYRLLRQTGVSLDAASRSVIKTFLRSDGRLMPEAGYDLSAALADWKKFRTGPFNYYFHRLLTLVLGLGIFGTKKFEWNIGSLEILSAEAEKKTTTAADLVEAIGQTIDWLIKGAYRCFESGTVRPLLFCEDSLFDFETMVFDLEEKSSYIKPGTMEKNAKMSLAEYSKHLEDAIEFGREVMREAKGPSKQSVGFLYSRLMKIKTLLTNHRMQGGLRERPYSLCFYGKSGVGKSAIAPVFMSYLLKANGFSGTQDKMCTLDSSDKYQSTMKGYTEGVFLDDVGNTKAATTGNNPHEHTIKLINNVKNYANKADVDEKASTPMEPKVVIANTNLTDFGATELSNYPISIANRYKKIVMTVREEYSMSRNGSLDSDKVFDEFGNVLLPDVWLFTIQEPVITNELTGTFGWKDVKKDLSVMELLQWLIKDSKRHFDIQRSLLERNSQIDTSIKKCDNCGFLGEMCTCPTTPETLSLIESESGEIVNFRSFDYFNFTRIGERLDVPRLFLGIIEPFYVRYHFWFDRPLFMTAVKLLYYVVLILIALTSAMSFFMARYGVHFLIRMAFTAIVTFAGQMVERQYRGLVRGMGWSILRYRYVRRQAVLAYLHARHNRPNRRQLMMGGIIVAAVTAYIVHRRMNSKKEEETEICGSTIATVEPEPSVHEPMPEGATVTGAELGGERGDDVWKVVPRANPLLSDKNRTVNPELLGKICQNNLCYMEYWDTGTEMGCDVFFVKGNFALAPSHVISEHSTGEFIATFYRKGDVAGTRFRSFVSEQFSSHIPGTDYSLIYLPSAGVWKDVREYLPLKPVEKVTSCIRYWKARDGEVREVRIPTLSLEEVTYCKYSYLGYYYSSPATYNGLCMAALVAECDIPYIAGFHLAGDKISVGVAGSLTQAQVNAAVDDLSSKPCIVKPVSAVPVPVERFGATIISSECLHPKSCLNWITSDAHISYYGSNNRRAKATSKVVPTVISRGITRECGVKNKWGPPRFAPNGEKWRPWFNTLQKVSCPNIGLPPSLLVKASLDYMRPLLRIMQTTNYSWMRPLKRVEIISGIDGVRFMDGINASSSIGFPLSGPKTRFLVDLEPTDEHACPRDLPEMFWEEVVKAERGYLEGRRAVLLFRGCLKDEGTKLDKEKVRMFMISGPTTTLLVRKYFLPLAKFLSTHPLVSECAVGVNCYSTEWHTLHMHMAQFGSDRTLAGDYSNYDLTMSSQLTLSSMKILIELAKASGNYTPNDLSIMEGIAMDLAYPIVDYNGDLIQLNGISPSGNPLTVILNGMNNSQIIRCAYFSYEFTEDFRTNAAIITYGDDLKGSVKRGCDFDHIKVRDFCAMHGIVFTMPDKSSVARPFMNAEDCDFLKRKSVWSPRYGVWRSQLDESSIFKSLHVVLKSDFISPHEAAAVNMDGALREFYYYGREVYEQRRAEFRRVAEDVDIAQLCPGLDISYSDRDKEWREKYFTNWIPNESEEMSSISLDSTP